MLAPVNRQLTLLVGVRTGFGGGSGGIGEQGPQGPMGPQGLTGPPGADGAPGINGANGAKGDKGDTGDQGPAGPAGQTTRLSNSTVTLGMGSKTLTYTETASNIGWAVGTRLRAFIEAGRYMEGIVTSVSSSSVTILSDFFTGSGDGSSWFISIAGDRGTNGTNGTNGADGLTGPIGPAGATGLKGDQGDPGPQGPQGIQGPIGLTGPKGDTGDTGIAGPSGNNGADGLDGASAYEIAIANGFVGTESAWIASLVGPTGATGAAGTNGATWSSGLGVPSGGVDGDFYLRTSNHDVYRKISGIWSVITNIKGLTGNTGSTGAAGAAAVMTRTSTTSQTITTVGSRTWNYSSVTNLGWTIGTRLRIANNSVNFMEGPITAVSSTSVTVNVDLVRGSGTYVSWTLSIAGERGLTGDTGAIGTAGTAGADGLSAYEVAVENGFTGSEATWLASLVGPEGAASTVPGPTGLTGPIGPQGIQGVPGNNGTSFPAFTFSSKTANYVAVNEDFAGNKLIEMDLASANTFTVNSGLTGIEPLAIAQKGIGQTTIVAGSGVTIKSSQGLKLRTIDSIVTLIPCGSNVYRLSGDTTL